MSKLKGVLSDKDFHDLGAQTATSNWVGFGRKLEQLLLTKLHEQQEPVAFIHQIALGNMHRDKKYARENQRVNLKVEKTHGAEVPLYAHPMPFLEQEPFAWFIDDKRVCGNKIITDPEVVKDWLETDPDKATPLYAHPCPQNERKKGIEFAKDAITGAIADGVEGGDGPQEDHWLYEFYQVGVSLSPASHKKACVSENAECEKQAKKSPTSGMNLGDRIKHVGGRDNKSGYVEFGSIMAVHALISHVLRDLGLDCANRQGFLDNSNHIPDTGKMVIDGWSKVELEVAIEQAKELVDDMSNFEYTRGVCELLSRLFPVYDVCTDERAEWMQRKIADVKAKQVGDKKFE